MSDSRPVSPGVNRPFGPEEKKEETIDPEKFKKILKIDESDEAQKRHKRQLKKEEEEGEDEEDKIDAGSQPASSFAEFMEDKADLDNVFKVETPGVQKRTLSQSPYIPEPPPTQPSISEEHGVEIPHYEVETHYTATPSFEPQGEGISQRPPSQPEPETDTSLLSSQPKKGSLTPTKKKGKPQKKEEIIPRTIQKPIEKKEIEKPLVPKEIKEVPPSLETLPKKEEMKGVKGPTSPPPKEEIHEEFLTEPAKKKPLPSESVFHRFTPQEIRKARIEKKKSESEEGLVLDLPIPSIPQGEMGMMGEKKKDKPQDYLEATNLSASIPLPPALPTLSPITPSAEIPAYAKLTPEVYELFEKMVGTIMIVQDTGITTTTMTLAMPNSIFDGATVVIDHYSSAPTAFNIQFIGSPQAVKAFDANITDLAAAFKQSEHAFEINILKPILETKKPLIKRKGSAGNQGGGGGKK